MISGDTFYRNEEGQLHNETGPAIIWSDGSMQYWINDKYHRIDGPAVIRTDGTMSYYIDGKHIRSLEEFQQLSNSTEEDMTAMILKYGHDGFTGNNMQKVTKTIEYGNTFYRNEEGQLHNETGPAFIGANGTVSYWINGKRHRTNGPAYIWSDGAVVYYINSKRHRIDGPAYIRADGTVEYYINGRHVTSLKEFQQLSKSTEEDMTMMILKYGHSGFTGE